MPVADGWAATKGMRELDAAWAQGGSEQQVQVPVVVCTASCLDDVVEGGETVAQRALTLGANGAVRKPLTTKAVLALLDEYAPRWRAAIEQQQHAAVGGSSPMTPEASSSGGAALLPMGLPVAAPAADAFTAPHGLAPHAEHHSWSGMPVRHPHHQHHHQPHQQQHAPLAWQQRQQRPAAMCQCTSAPGGSLPGGGVTCGCGGAGARAGPAVAAAAGGAATLAVEAGRRFLQMGGSGGPLDGRTLCFFASSRDLSAGGTAAAGNTRQLHQQQARQCAQQLLLKRCSRSGHRELSRTRPDCMDSDARAASASAHAHAGAAALQRHMSFDVAAMSWMMAARRSTSPGYSRANGVAPPASLVVAAAALG
ncbi:hypothetical protein HYH02_002039 [Chlamydomonas schloesseri]|uniref:Response regulatory domain-containing protein n=1 Tax=Chlamydomonas schloesseri TaxID=2026947 RepID=A0A836BBT0_9CHLO|nr:hypothetical protein HYH02_002039 [Chlamydomonas schloesseri]|eukprot:KAG2453832.1 hypothetical protein HYH02_002039 [Chlamydomonas schloesseri]